MTDKQNFALRVNTDDLEQFRIFKNDIVEFQPVTAIEETGEAAIDSRIYAFRMTETGTIFIGAAMSVSKDEIMLYVSPERHAVIRTDDAGIQVIGRWASIRRDFSDRSGGKTFEIPSLV